jgi:pyruvate dehydrogenase E2 component (dihydrolipoamide acetyltransferase)
VQEGETVSVGTELAVIDANGDGQAAEGKPPEQRAEEPPTAQESEREEQARARPAEEEPPAEPPKAEEPPEPPKPAEGTGPEAAATDGEGRGSVEAERAAPPAADGDGGARSHILSPLVRRLAEEHQVDLAQVRGTGTGGRITKQDVLAFVESGKRAPAAAAPPAAAAATTPQAAPAPTASAAGDREEVIPLTRMRQSIAKHMVASIQTSARAWNLVEVNMENVVRVRNAAKDAFKEREGVSLTFMPFVARAVCEALLAFPDVNAELREDQLVRKHYVSLGIAVALDDGLIVPVVKGADEMNLVGLARAINDIATRARSKKLTPDDVHGSTFTITNPGPFGSIMSVPIINQPNCAILAFDAVEKRPVVIDDAIAIRHMVYLSMSWDHRIIDGATAAKFLGRLKQNLETWDFGPELGLPARGA